MSQVNNQIEVFNFKPGRVLAGRYLVRAQIGSGREGELYRVTEARTGIDRAAKVFYPHQNVRDRAARFYANKLIRLRDCPAVVQYHHAVSLRYHGTAVTCLISDLVEGERLSDFLDRQPGRRLSPFEAMHLLHALLRALEQLHAIREYHGDLQIDNLLVARRGIDFGVQLVDLRHHGRASARHFRDDVIQLVRVFHHAIGGQARYAAQPPEVKTICCGLRSDLIGQRYPTAQHLREHLERFDWG